MALHTQPQVWRGKRLRTIRAIYHADGKFGLVKYGILDCGHHVRLADRSHNKVGERTTCEVCR